MADNRSFDRWLRTVDRIVMQQCGATTIARSFKYRELGVPG